MCSTNRPVAASSTSPESVKGEIKGGTIPWSAVSHDHDWLLSPATHDMNSNSSSHQLSGVSRQRKDDEYSL
jgi:hypothetical protein